MRFPTNTGTFEIWIVSTLDQVVVIWVCASIMHFH